MGNVSSLSFPKNLSTFYFACFRCCVCKSLVCLDALLNRRAEELKALGMKLWILNFDTVVVLFHKNFVYLKKLSQKESQDLKTQVLRKVKVFLKNFGGDAGNRTPVLT